jgi:hypothetical protein
MMLCRTLVFGFWFPVSGLQFLPSGFSHLTSDFVCPRENGAIRWLNRVTWASYFVPRSSFIVPGSWFLVSGSGDF